MKYFLYDYKDATKIHKKLFKVPGHPVISNCGTPTEKVSEFVDHHLKPVMQSSWDSGGFLRKIKQIKNLLEKSILIIADVVGLYPRFPNELGLTSLKESLEKSRA